jgi:hypothetical protein
MLKSMNVMTREELLGLFDEMTLEAKGIMKAKNADYSGGKDDVFANFRGCTAFGVEPELGLMIRMQDKMKRVESFVEKGRLEVRDEGVRDTCIDLINYSVLLYGLLLERTEAQRILRTNGVTVGTPMVEKVLDPQLEATPGPIISEHVPEEALKTAAEDTGDAEIMSNTNDWVDEDDEDVPVSVEGAKE